MRLAWVLALGAQAAFAAGPSTVAWLSADSWPDGLAGKERFDQASSAEVLQLAAVLQETPFVGDGPVRWAQQNREALQGSWLAASGKPIEWAALAALAKAAPPNEPHRLFWTSWVGEQVRLARLFPKTTSEVFPLRPTDVLGEDEPDRTFELTLDDGPTATGGTSDSTVDRLRALRLPATFFVLGERLAARKDARALYEGFCVASHGMSHVAHTDLVKSKASFLFTRDQLAASVDGPRLGLMRPPYGQRGEEFAQWLEGNHVRTVLWNIDSQDWRTDAQAQRVAGRVLALMLVQRHGVILFHDVHPIAREAIGLVAAAVGDAVTWSGCQRWPAPD